MARARPKFVQVPPQKGFVQGATYFRFTFDLDNKTPLHGTPFVVFISDELGLNATAAVDEKGLNVLYTDTLNNWLRHITVYAYAEIYIKACLLTNEKLSEAGTNAFIEYASKLVKITFHGSKILLSAPPDEWALLKNSVKKRLISQTAQPQTVLPQPVRPQPTQPQALQPQALQPQAVRPQAVDVQALQRPQAIQAQATLHKAKANRHCYAGPREPSLKMLRG